LEPDNRSFLLEFAGRKILHLGECQGLMTALGEAESDLLAREAMEGRTDGLGRSYRTLPLPKPAGILEGRPSQGEVLVVGLTPGPPGRS
jgi:hypothetical protein